MDDTTVMEQAAQAIADMEQEARLKARAAKEGDVLGEVDLGEGVTVRRRKQSSMVRSGDVELPERVRYYRSKEGWEAWLPTVQLVHHLSKRHPDGTPVFVKEKPQIAEQIYGETCEICLKNSMGRVRKKFRDEFAYVGHMEILHPREYRVIQRREEQKRGSQVTATDIATALLNMNAQERQAVRALIGEEKQDGATEQAHCEACGWTSRPVKNAGASLRTHTNLHCPKHAGGAADGGE